MKTLLVYDATGRIIFMGSGDVLAPTGIPFLWVEEIPQGKRIISVNTSVTPNVPVYEDIQKTETQILQEQIQELTSKMTVNEDTNLMVLEAMADVYESVLPFLPV